MVVSFQPSQVTSVVRQQVKILESRISRVLVKRVIGLSPLESESAGGLVDDTVGGVVLGTQLHEGVAQGQGAADDQREEHGSDGETDLGGSAHCLFLLWLLV